MGRKPAFSGISRMYDNTNAQEEHRGNERRPASSETSVGPSMNTSAQAHGLDSQIGYGGDLAMFQQYDSSEAQFHWPVTVAGSSTGYGNWTVSQLMPESAHWNQPFSPIATPTLPSSPDYLTGATNPGNQSSPIQFNSMHYQSAVNSDSGMTSPEDTLSNSFGGYLGTEGDQDYESPGNNDGDVSSSRNLHVSDSGRLTTIRERSANRQFRSCWRCKRYRKSCDEDAVCNSCMKTGGFRVWPSSLGCRRGNLEDSVVLIIPENLSSLDSMNQEYFKPFNWRRMDQAVKLDSVSPMSGDQSSNYDRTIQMVRSTYVHGPGIVELLELGAAFQHKQAKENLGIQTAFSALSMVMELYHSLVSTTGTSIYDSSQSLKEKFVDVRRSIIRFTDRFLLCCLTGRVKLWPTTFLAANIGVIALIFLADAILAIPESIRRNTWRDLKQVLLDLRGSFYSVAQNLLLPLSKGVEMLNMTCWRYMVVNTDENPAGPLESQPNNHGMQLMDHDRDAFDLMCGLSQWRTDYETLLRDDMWMSTGPFEVDLPMIKALSRLFSMTG